MGILKFLLKPRRKMAKKHTAYVDVGKYHLTSHCQSRIVERQIKKRRVIGHFLFRELADSPTKIDEKGQPSYNRIGRRITSSINPSNNNVVTIRNTNKREAKSFGLEKRRNGSYGEKR
jgi:hypothetical protein